MVLAQEIYEKRHKWTVLKIIMDAPSTFVRLLTLPLTHAMIVNCIQSWSCVAAKGPWMLGVNVAFLSPPCFGD